MEIDPGEIAWQSMYKLMTGAIVPRPIGWISSINADGQPNLAPFSFFNAVCPNPPTVLFCPTNRGTGQGLKDTLTNIQANGEFVVNIVTEALAEKMNITSTDFPVEVNEFEAAGLRAIPSVAVKPPRVAESPVHFECRLSQIVSLGDQPGGGSIVIGRVVHIHVHEDVLLGVDKIDPHRLKAIGRLAGSQYCRISDLFEMVRPPSQIGKIKPTEG